MEISDNQYTETPGNAGLQPTRNMKVNWLSTSKWAMFLAIIGFIYIGLALLAVFFMMPMLRMALAMSGQSELAGIMESAGTVFVLFMLLVLAVMFFIHFFHLRFSNSIQRALQFDDQNAFEAAWRNLRLHFRLYGIFLIAYIAIYLIFIVFMLTMASSMGSDF